MAKIGILAFLDSKDPGPTTISNRGGGCTSGDAATGVPPVPGACAIAVVVGVGAAVTTVVVVVVEVEVDEDAGADVGVGVGLKNTSPGLSVKLALEAWARTFSPAEFTTR